MNLTSPPRSNSLYESFSDLIFATLIIFIVVVLALVLQIRGAQLQFDQACESQIVLNQFTGGPDLTQWHVAIILRQGEPHVAFIPREAWSVWTATRFFEHTNPVMDLCRSYLREPRAIAIVSQDEFQRMGDAISHQLFAGQFQNSAIGLVLNRIVATEQLHQGTLRGWAPLQLYEFIGGINAGSAEHNPPNSSDPYDSRLQQSNIDYFNFLFAGNPYGDDDPIAYRWRYEQLLEPLSDAVNHTVGDPPRVQFRATSNQRIALGDMQLSPEQFAALLRTFSVGKEFYIEYLGESNDPEAPPEWIMRRALIPSGFDKRVASDAAIAALRGLRRDP